MLHLNAIRDDKEEVIRRLSVKNFDGGEIINKVIGLDDERKKTKNELDTLLAHQNTLAKQVGGFFRQGRQAEADELKTKSASVKETSKKLHDHMEALETEIHELLVRIPNPPSAQVPRGETPDDNEIVFSVSHLPDLEAAAVPHWELAAKYNLINFELGNKITGAGFPVYINKGARLQRALINFFLDKAVAAGYVEYQPPILINEESSFGTGQLPDREGQMYHVGGDNLYLIPTAEVPLTNIFRDVILKQEELPKKLTAYTPCFRREAGSYGAHVRGLNRLHQFDKVEIVQVVHPHKSYDVLEEMKDHVAGLLQMLELPYRILRLCGGDMSFASALTYDMEVYSAAQKKWLEVSSVSNFETFQSNRLKLRYKEPEGKPQLAHTLNGSALALPRIVAALLENNQTPEGVVIPKALVPYTLFERIT